MFLSSWLMITRVVAASVVEAVDYPTPEDFFLVFNGTNTLLSYGGSKSIASNVSIYFEDFQHEMGNTYPVNISEPGEYKARLDMCGKTYLTNAVSVGSVSVNAEKSFEDSQQARLQASVPTEYSNFASSVAIYGDYLIVGTPYENVGELWGPGVAYIFKRDGTSWTQQAKIQASDPAEYDNFGTSVAIYGDYAVVGARGKKMDALYSVGAAYIFKRDGTSWTQQAKIQASDPAQYDNFGTSVAIYGDYAVVGARGKKVGELNGVGAAYIFKRDGTSWTQQAKIQASGDPVQYDNFGTSVAIYGDYAVVGANGVDDVQLNAVGAVFIFKRDGTSWTLQGKIQTIDLVQGSNFGYSVAIYGDYAVVGAYNETIDALSSAGAAYIFKREGTSWTQQAKIQASDPAQYDYFGFSVAIYGDYAVVGAYSKTVDALYGVGAAYIFKRDGTSWTQLAKIQASVPGEYQNFGRSVAIYGDYAVVGANNEKIGEIWGPGAAYVFKSQDLYQLNHDGFDKLTINNTSNENVKTNLRLGSNVWDVGSVRNVYICKPGAYKSFTVDPDNQAAYFGNVTVDSVTTTTPPTVSSVRPGIVAFHNGDFDNRYGDASVTIAAMNGRIFADTPTGVYSWGTLNSRTKVYTKSPAYYLSTEYTLSQTVYTWTPPLYFYATDILMVAGGGGGGCWVGGGGGGGGLVYNQNVNLSGTKTITVGGGGPGALRKEPYYAGMNGYNTTFTDLETAVGGGGGGSLVAQYPSQPPGSGGSGGGGGGGYLSYSDNSRLGATASPPGQGNNGGDGVYNGWSGGGGGGWGGVGSNGSGATGGNGGDGRNLVSVFTYKYGDQGWFSGGGGGCGSGYSYAGTGGQGGGANGGNDSIIRAETTPHSGGGGGGTRDGNILWRDGSDGASGIVLIKYQPITITPSLTYDSFNKLTVNGFDSQTLYEGSNSYALGTASNVYIADPGEYTYFTVTPDYAFLSNVSVGGVSVEKTWVGSASTEQKIVAQDGAVDDIFGRSVAIDGDTMVIGAPLRCRFHDP